MKSIRKFIRYLKKRLNCLRNLQNLDILTWRQRAKIFRILDKSDDIVSGLKKIQRISRISAIPAISELLVEANMHSAFMIVKKGEADFLRVMRNDLTISDLSALTLWKIAVKIDKKNKLSDGELEDMLEQKPSVANIDVFCRNCREKGFAIRRGPRLPFFNWLFSYYGCHYCGSRKIDLIPPASVWNKTQIENLRYLLGSINNEITRYRDYEWKIVSLSIVLFWGIFAFATGETIGIEAGIKVFADISAIFLIVVGGVLLSAHLLFVHGELTTNRNWRRSIEIMLGLYDSEKPLPHSWNKGISGFKNGRDTFIIPFILFMEITSLGLSYLIAIQVPICSWIKPGSLFEILWIYSVPILIGMLMILELYYVIRAVFVQGLGKRGSY
jgi:hypothetical protein